MLHPSTQQLIRKLCELTEDGAINWKEGENGASLFETEGYVVEIKADPPGFRLLRHDGRELERADAPDLAAAWPDGEGTYASNVALMANRAGRIARGAESAIAKILSSLSAPPKRASEPEPESAALAFDGPPVSHTLPDPAPVISPETETAIDRVLAIQPAPQPPSAPEKIEEPPPPPVMEAAPPVEPEPEPASSAPPVLIEPEEPESEPAPAATTAAPEPEPPKPASQPEPPPAAAVPSTPEPVAATPQTAPSGFGAITGFARSQTAARSTPTPVPASEQSKVTSGGLLVRGFSARTLQTAEPALANDMKHPGAPQPSPRPAEDEKELETTARSGADIYKPWS